MLHRLIANNGQSIVIGVICLVKYESIANIQAINRVEGIQVGTIGNYGEGVVEGRVEVVNEAYV